MTMIPSLFDHALLRQRLRSRPTLLNGSDFLFARAAEELVARMQPILRPFPYILDIGTPTRHAIDAVATLRPHARIVPKGLVDLQSEALSLPAQAFDLITSCLVLQHANDLPGVLVQLQRALRPDGLFIGCLLGGGTLTELRQVLTQAESDVTGGVSPRVFPFADVRDMGGLLQRAGFALPVADSEAITVRYDNVFHLMADIRAMGGTNILHQRSRRFTSARIMTRAAELYAERFADADGRIRATFEMIWLSGWAPHESQQKPLKPGSAKLRLADALGVVEKPV